MLTKTTTLTAVQPMLFIGECCKVTYTDRADWDAHHKTVHPGGKDLISERWKSKPHIFFERLAPAPTTKLRPLVLTKDEKTWLGKHVTLTVKRWDSLAYGGSGGMRTVHIDGYVWCLHHGRTVSITVYDAEKGHNVIETGHIDSLTLA